MAPLSEICRVLRESDNFLILTHRRPDGDTIGSAAALCRGLRALGKQAQVLNNPDLTPRYARFLEGLACDEAPEGAFLISTDVASPDMLPVNAMPFAGCVDLALDHHESNPGFARLNHICPDFAATGELIYALLQELSQPLDAAIGEALYLAVSTDTGCFRYSNTTAHTLRTAAACLEAGADCFRINREIFSVKSAARIRLESYLGANIELLAGGRVGICQLPQQVMRELHATEDDADDLSGFARSIEGVEIGVMIRELPDGSGKLSLRTGETYNAAELCGRLGGGGHRAAAGATIPGGLASAHEAILRTLREVGIQLEEETCQTGS